MEPIRVVVATAQPLLALGLAAACALGDGEIACVASPPDADALAVACSRWRPDVAVAEPALLKPDRVAAVATLTAMPVRVLLLGGPGDLDDVGALVLAGAAGAVPADATAAAFRSAIHAAAIGALVLQPGMTRSLLGPKPAGDDRPQLTPRELEILALVAAGRCSREIAAALFVSETTVKTHIERVNEKLGTRRRTAAVAEAMRRGLLDDPVAA